MTITRNFKLCLNAGTQNAPYINANQYDEGEEWVFDLYTEGGQKFTPSTGAIIGIKSDGNAILNSGTVNSDGQVVITETQQMTAASGLAVFELLIEGETHGTANFIVNVERRPSDDAEFSDSDLSLLQQAVDSVATIEGLLDGETVDEKLLPIVQSETGTWLTAHITNPSNPPIDTSLTVAGAAADAKVVGDDISELKSAIDAKPNEVPYIEQSNLAKASKTGTAFIIKEKNPVNFKNVNGVSGTVHGRNRFDLENASFTMTGYSSSYTITKENNGIKIVCTLTNTTSSHYAYVDYTAEFTGKLYLSCVAKLISGNIVCASMIMRKNGVTVEQTFGEGLNYIATDVVAGDTIRIGFYGHIMDGVGSTVAYKNIMLSYGGLYPFTPFIANAPTGKITAATSDYVLANHIADGSYSSTFKWVMMSAALADMFALPSDNDTLPENVEIICDESVPLFAYNTLSSDNTLTGIGIGRTGSVAFRINGMNKTAMTSWLSEHPLTIRYKTGESYEGSEVPADRFQQGIILSYASLQYISYLYEKEVKSKTLVCFGDSITGMFAGDADYPSMISLDSEVITVNCGFSGTGYCDHTNANYLPFSANRLIEAVVDNDFSTQDASPLVDSTSSSYEPLYAEHLQNLKDVDFTNVDYVSFFYGTNDWGSNKPLYSNDDPSAENKQRTNVEDAVKYCVGDLVRKYPNLKIFVVTPYWRTTTSYPDSNVDPNTIGVYLYEYSDGIAGFASTNFNVPVLNLYRSFGANAITNRYFTKDGTHPNENGKWIIAKRILELIASY